MESLIFDTSFLIDFQRERKQGAGGAHAFLEADTNAHAYLPIIAYGEFGEGFASQSDPTLVSMVESFQIVEIDRAVAQHYATITRTLRERGRLIGSNDLWIAACALRAGMPLVTRNLDHFSRVPHLQVVTY